MLKIAVVVSGGGTNLQALIDAERAGAVKGGKICVVVADREGVYALTRAADSGIPAYVADRRVLKIEGFERRVLEIFAEHSVDVIVLAGFTGVFSADFVGRYPKRIINIHCSLIPKYCGKGFYGMRVHEAVLAAGERVSGATVHYVNEVIDGGEIILQKEVEVKEDDTPQSLKTRVLAVEWEILPRALQAVINALGKNRFDGSPSDNR